MTSAPKDRRTARRHAFSLIYSLAFHPGLTREGLAGAIAHYYEGLEDEMPPKGRDAEYVARAVWGVFERVEHLDGVIDSFLRGWSLDRIPSVDLAILRLAVYEIMREEDVPVAVAVNEAVELAKEFGTEDSPGFINGVLSAVSKQMPAKKQIHDRV